MRQELAVPFEAPAPEVAGQVVQEVPHALDEAHLTIRYEPLGHVHVLEVDDRVLGTIDDESASLDPGEIDDVREVAQLQDIAAMLVERFRMSVIKLRELRNSW